MANRNQDKMHDMEYLAFIPIPSHMTEVNPIDPTFHRASEVTFRLVRPETLRATAPGFSLRRFCREIISNFNAYAATPGTSDLEMEGRAIGLLAKAYEDFNRYCPSSLHLFSAWAFRNARSIDSTKTGADVFLRLMTWVNPFPESPDHLDDLLDICDSLGCKYTIVMLAFGIYPGFRPFSERKTILERLGVVAQAVQTVPPSYLARNKFLDRALHFAATLRTMQIASQHVNFRFPKVVFPSPAEVSVSLQWCMELLPFEIAPIVYHVETPDEPDEEDISYPGPVYDEPSDEEYGEDQQPAPSQPDFDMPALTERRPPVRTRRAHRTRSNVASRGNSPAEGPAAEKSASSSSSMLKRPSGQEQDHDQEAPTAKRQNVGVQQSVVEQTSKDPSSSQTLTAQHTGSLQPFHAGHAAPQQPTQCMSSMQLMAQENTVHDQFIDFVTRFHDNLNTNGSNYLQYLVMQHGLLVEQVRLQTEPENQGQPALPEEVAGPDPSQVGQGTQAQPPATTLAPSAMPATDTPHVQQPQETQARAFSHEHEASPHPTTPPPNSMGPEHGTSQQYGMSQHNGGRGGEQGGLGQTADPRLPLHWYITPPKCPLNHACCNKQQDELQTRCSQQRSYPQGGNRLTQDQANQVAHYRAKLYARLQEQVRMIPVNYPTQPIAGTSFQPQAPPQQPGNMDYFGLQMQVPPLRPVTASAERERAPPRASYTYAVRADASEIEVDEAPPPPYEAAHPPASSTIASPTTRAGTFGLLAGQNYVESGSSGTDNDEDSSDGESSEESEDSENDARDSSDEDESTSEEVNGGSAGDGRARRSLRLSTRGA